MNAITTAKPIVFIVDDNKQIHVCIRKVMESVELNVISYYFAKDFWDNFQPEQAGCLLLDLRMPDMCGLELYERMIVQDICLPVIMMTSFGDVATVKRAYNGKIFDFIEKPFSPYYLLEQVQKAIKQDAECRQEREKRQELLIRLKKLTPKEYEVMMKLVQGYSIKEIAYELQVTHKTVDNHKTNLMRKIRINNVVELVHIALFCKLLTPAYLFQDAHSDSSLSLVTKQNLNC